MTNTEPKGSLRPRESLATVARKWGRIGCLGFGGPPSHVVMLRDLCVHRRRWLTDADFEDAVVACNLLPGPASTQLAIFCASRIRGRLGALVGGLAFILPGLAIVLVLSSLFLAHAPPTWISGAAAGAGAIAGATVGAYIVLVLLACGTVEITRRANVRRGPRAAFAIPLANSTVIATGGLAALAWTAFKVGALAYGGGFDSPAAR